MMHTKKVLGIIPARFASSRFPGKPLADLGGKSLLQRVYEQAAHCSALDRVVVATDDERIAQHARDFGALAIMTDVGHHSGTDRCAEVAGQFPDFDLCVNIQGDEPFLHPEDIEQALAPLIRHAADIGTLARPLRLPEELLNPNVVKVALSLRGQALYFSRSPIPHVRGIAATAWLERGIHYQHIGLYAFQREVLLELAALSPTPLEQAESLEQLRWLEHGKSIYVGITTNETIGVDTPEDLEKALAYLRQRIAGE